MLPEIVKNYSTESIKKIFLQNPSTIMVEFHEMQTQFLAIRYKMNGDIESSNILTLLGKGLHLEILRVREKILNFNISLKNFLKVNDYIRKNIDSFNHGFKIVSIVKKTGIPKETVRRKLKKLIENKTITYDKKNKLYSYNVTVKNEELYSGFIENDIRALARFILCITRAMRLNLNLKDVENEIKSEFSFYYFHYYQSQLAWMKMWQDKIKDIDLIFISLQALIPTLKAKKNSHGTIDSLHSSLGKIEIKKFDSQNTIGASSISDISGIPRATCIRKLEKLVKLGMLARDKESKRYYVNQNAAEREEHVLKKDNIIQTINIFSEFLSIMLSSLIKKT